MLVRDYIPLVLVDTENLPREEWLEWRRKGIGGSDAATIIGVSPFSTARDLYYDKLNIGGNEQWRTRYIQKDVYPRFKSLFLALPVSLLSARCC